MTDGDVIYDKSENLMSNYPSGTVATHSCSADFGFVGESTRTCMASAVNIGLTTWSGEPINCQRKLLGISYNYSSLNSFILSKVQCIVCIHYTIHS